MNKGLGFSGCLVLPQLERLPSGVICTIEGIKVVLPSVLAVQVLLEPSALAGPKVSPEWAYEPKGFVKGRVRPDDDHGKELDNLFHNTMLLLKVITLEVKNY